MAFGTDASTEVGQGNAADGFGLGNRSEAEQGGRTILEVAIEATLCMTRREANAQGPTDAGRIP